LQLHEIIEVGLEGQEYVSLLSWIIQTYPGQELMRSTSLGIPPEKIKPLLDNKVIEDLQTKYLKVKFSPGLHSYFLAKYNFTGFHRLK